MKFLFVGTNANLNLERIGGIESTMREFLSFLKKENHDVEVLIIAQKSEKEKFISTDFGDITVKSKSIAEARKYLFKDFDVINFLQTPFTNPFFALKFLLYKSFNKVTTTKFFFTYPTLYKYTFFQKLKLKLLIDTTFVFSKRLENIAKKIVKNVVFIYPPVAEQYIVLEKERNEENNQKRILFVGRLSKDKGLDIVIDVFKTLPKEKFYLSIIGYFSNEKDEKKYKEKLQNLKIDELKIVAHQRDKNQILPLNKYDILLLPYQELGPTLDTPLLILEGLSSNCKIITSNIEPLNYIKGNIFFVNDFSNPQAFSEKIEEIFEEKNLANTYDYSTDAFGKMYLSSLKGIKPNV